MKTSFSNRELPHVWLNLTDAELDGLRSGRGSNFAFHGPELVSYQTTVARIYRKGAARLVLIDSNRFSPSTGKQLGYLSRALRPVDLTVSLDFGRRGQSLRFSPLEMWEAAKAEAKDYAQQASEARGRGPFLLSLASDAVAKAEKIRTFFKLRNKPFAPDLSTLAEQMKEETKKAAVRAALLAEKRAAYVAKHGPELLNLWRTHQEMHPRWLAISDGAKKIGAGFTYAALITSPDFAGTSALRLSVDGSRVETSQGAQVLVRTVRFLWAFCRHAKATGAALDSETLARFPRLDNYRADSIDAGGNLSAGCHRIPFAEVENIARALNLPPFDGAPAEAPTIPESAEVLA